MKKSHRVALKPTPEQESLFPQHAGYARFAYNWAVGEFQAGLQVGEWLSEKSLRPRWNLLKGIIAPWGRELSQNAAKYAIIDLGQAASRWGEYRRKRKQGIPCRRVGFPRFKRREHEQGFRADNGPDTVMALGRTVILPRIGRVAMVEHLRFSGRINEVTVNRTAGRWFACFPVETGEPPPPVKDGPTVGVDVGIENLAVCSGGTVVENPRALKPALRRLRNLDKAIARSRKAHGGSAHSNRLERLYARRRRLHARMVNVRNDLHHKATTAIAKPARRVVTEDLNVAGMMSNRRLSRALADAGISGFLTKLEYKCRWYGAELAKVDQWRPSSKLCSGCGAKNEGLTLSERRRRCDSCGAPHERHLNAALNLEKAGFELPGAGRGDLVRPAMPAEVCEASRESVVESWDPAKLENQVSSDSE